MVTEATEAPDDGASEDDDPEPTTARIECICPPKANGDPRHPDGDVIEFRERLDFTAGRTARNIVTWGLSEGRGVPEIMTQLSEWYFVTGIRTWTVVDAKGKPVEPNRYTIREYLLDREDQTVADALADKVTTLYSGVLAPLAVGASNSSPPTPNNSSTSRTNGSSPKPRKPSKRSSITTIPTAATEMTG